MKLIRISVVTLVAVAVLAMAVPAQARIIENPQPVLQSQGGAWLDLAVIWLARLTGNEPVGRMTAKTTSGTGTGTGTGLGPVKVPMTGGCIDPLGLGRCNL
jgi:hypothetical protein